MSRITSSRGVKLLIIIVAIFGLGVGVAFLWVQRTKTNTDLLLLYGNVDIREVQLAFRQPGRVAEMSFDEGDAVKAGARMAVLDAQPYREALAAAEASVQMAQAELAKLRHGLRPQEVTQAREALKQAQAIAADAERNYQRQSSLLASGATSQRTVDAARAIRDQSVAGVGAAKAALSQASEGFRKEDIAAAEARLAAAQAAKAQAVTALTDAELLAPSDGTVIARVREPGSMVASQSTVYSLSLDKPVYVRAYVGEPDLGRIAPGTTVRVKSDTSDTVYRGQIGFISPRAEFTPKTVETTDLRTDLVYRLRIVIDETDRDAALRQGMPVTIEIDATTRMTSDIGSAGRES
ncbi:secretion protein HlyD [Thauera chlorobenzoica]|uniref:ABC drug transporter, membrane protein YbhG-like n=1 Tax=Thauera chlorobenzoica TaxID=96773 RepID=A0A1H5T3I7_9RHOO|nr:secretion protein HlyD [Thauera chlorobenzoica]APR04166.1 ABC drug transporter, membrane protein YbhG-like [Thauera chlorobenzoica]SEF57360.1 HlyD family secretion protein [Thauera chlorobenzoica]